MKFHETVMIGAMLTFKSMQASLQTAELLISAPYISRETKVRADQFVQHCVNQMQPFTQALIASEPRQLDGNLELLLYKQDIPGYRATQERLCNVKAEVSMLKDLHDDMKQSGHQLRAQVLSLPLLLGKLQMWAVQRQLTKIYAGATLS